MSTESRSNGALDRYWEARDALELKLSFLEGICTMFALAGKDLDVDTVRKVGGGLERELDSVRTTIGEMVSPGDLKMLELDVVSN